MHKIFIIIFLFLGITAFAGDVATFINLGFSENGHYFMFGQYGEKVGTNQTVAESYIISCSKNAFVKDGVLKYEKVGIPKLGSDSIGVMFNLLRENKSIVEKYRIDHANNGKTIFFLTEGEKVKNELSFRVFDEKSGIKNIQCKLLEKSFDPEGEVSSQFHIDLKWIDSRDSEKSAIVGLPDYRRKGVKSYFIKSIILSSDYKCLIFVIGKVVKAGTEINLEYMVESVSLK